MPYLDGVLYVLLCVVAVVWWWRSGLVLFALLALVVAGAWGVEDHRWQAAVAVASALVLGVVYLITRKRTGPAWISGGLAVVLCAFAALSLWWFPHDDLPPPDGPLPVGVRDFLLVDGNRLGVLAAAADEPRKLLVRVWYPAEPLAAAEPRPYFTEAEASTTASGLGNLMGASFLLQYLKHARTNAVEGAPPAVADSPRPVVVYSHGYTSFAGQNTALMESLASHGYLVYSVHHSYDSSPPVFPDGTVLQEDPALLATLRSNSGGGASPETFAAFTGATHADRRAGQLAMREAAIASGQRLTTVSAPIWVADRVFVLDALADGMVPQSVADIVAQGSYELTGQMGMSFGGSTTGSFCMVDRRCAAGVNLDGGDYHYTAFNRNMPVPFLMMYSDYQRLGRMLSDDPDIQVHAYNDYSYERHEVVGVRDDIHRFAVRDVTHLGYSDLTYFMRNPVRERILGPIDGERMLRIQNDFVRGFFDRYLGARNIDFPSSELAQHDAWVTAQRAEGLSDWWLREHPEDRVELVRFDTSAGMIDVAVYPERATVSAANFLRYVDQGLYDGATLYRASRRSDGAAIEVVQGGLYAQTLAHGDAYERAVPPLGTIPHETTHDTGIGNEMGVIAYARLAPGTAGSEFFFNVSDNPMLDTDAGTPGRDGFGYATFGRIVQGTDVLRRVHGMTTGAPTDIEVVRGQLLDEPVVIRSVRRLERQP